MWEGTAVVVASYLIGSISFALLFARRRGIDLRDEGSGNPGATNAGRVLGRRTGRLVLVLDALKGAVPVAAAALLFGREDPIVAAAGVAATLGHVFPIWHGLRGGKGAATGVGTVLAASPLAGMAAAIVFFAARKLSKRASVGSLGAAATAVLAAAFIEGRSYITAMTMAVAAIIAIRHVGNVRRLCAGEEPPP